MKPLVVTLSVLVAVSAVASQVSFDENTDFSKLRTFAWKTGTDARNPNMQERIVAGVERELEVKGLTRDDDRPDVYVASYVLPGKVSAGEIRSASSLEFWSGVTSVSPDDMGAGTLVVDIVDADTGKSVWRGIASKTIKGSFEKMARRVDDAITKMFKSYPPR